MTFAIGMKKKSDSSRPAPCLCIACMPLALAAVLTTSCSKREAASGTAGQAGGAELVKSKLSEIPELHPAEETAGPLSVESLFAEPNVTPEGMWAALSSRYPELLEGDDAIIRIFPELCLNATGRQKSFMAQALAHHLSTPAQAFKLKATIGDQEFENDYMLGLVNVFAESHPSEIREIVKDIAHNQNRLDCGASLLGRHAIENWQEALRDARDLSRDGNDMAYYEGSLTVRIYPEDPGASTSAEARKLAKDILPSLSAESAKFLSEQMAEREISISRPGSVTEAAENWGLDPIQLAAMTGQHLGNDRSRNAAMTIADVKGWVALVPPDHPAYPPFLQGIIRPVVGVCSDSEVLGLFQDVPKEGQPSLAFAMGAIFVQNVSLDRANTVAPEIPAAFKKNFEQGVKLGAFSIQNNQ